jgi:hypothetical protein
MVSISSKRRQLAPLALGEITFAVIQAFEDRLGPPPVFAAIVVGLASAVAFVRAEQRSTLGPILIAVGMVMMRGIHAGDSYVGSVLPPTRRLPPRLVARGRPDHSHGPRRRRRAARRRGLGPEQRRCPHGRARGGRGAAADRRALGCRLREPGRDTDGFRVAVLACAILSLAGGALAWVTISNDVLETTPAADGDVPDRAATNFTCGIAGTPLRPAREAR